MSELSIHVLYHLLWKFLKILEITNVVHDQIFSNYCAFSIQTWLLSGRRVTMTPENCNVRIFGRSCKSLKRRIKEVEAEIRAFEERKLDQN